MEILPGVVEFFLKLEGPYKWYVIGGVLIVLTALVTRFIFKTLKWFIIIVLAGVVVVAIVSYFRGSLPAPRVGDRAPQNQTAP